MAPWSSRVAALRGSVGRLTARPGSTRPDQDHVMPLIGVAEDVASLFIYLDRVVRAEAREAKALAGWC